MPIHDISLPVSASLPVWPGDPPFRLSHPSHLDRGDLMTLSRVEMGAHTGTHVDAPAHFLPGGPTVDALDLGVLIGPAQVVYAPGVDAVSAEVLDSAGLPPATERVLFRTRNSDLWNEGEGEFRPDYVGITTAGLRWLVDRGVRLVGIDALSVAPYDETVIAHRLLLAEGVIVVEGLNLTGIAPGEYLLICLPLRLSGAEGAPARAVLIDRGGAPGSGGLQPASF